MAKIKGAIVVDRALQRLQSMCSGMSAACNRAQCQTSE